MSVVATPLLLVVCATALKDAFEDYKRHVQDRTVNERRTKRLDGGWNSRAEYVPLLNDSDGLFWADIKWHDIVVGDLLLLHKNESVPADMVIISTSEEDCLCYVETMNLDGETNMKERQGPSSTRALSAPHDFLRLSFTVVSEDPSADLNSYQGVIDFHGNDSYSVPVDLTGILLRGTVLRNTDWVTGIVVNTGTDTKQVRNAGVTPSKQSELDKMMNLHVAFNLLVMVVICIVSSIAYGFWSSRNSGSFYLGDSIPQNGWLNAFVGFWSGLILYQNMVPIALYICIELVKTFQAYLISQDLEMYHEKTNEGCQVKTWNIGDNLGQIEYIFSDKTGTLTRNIMEFKHCSIQNATYLGDGNQETPDVAKFLSKTRFSLELESEWLLDGHSANKVAEIDYGDHRETQKRGWFDPSLDYCLSSPSEMNSAHGVYVNHFFSCIAICHSVMLEKVSSASDSHSLFRYRSQSPDEECLVAMASENGYVFEGRRRDADTGFSVIQVRVNGVLREYMVLALLEFSSTRKRMSVIVRSLSSGGIILYSKGADTVMFERLSSDQEKHRSYHNSRIEGFSEEGLRTLVLCYRDISQLEFDEWFKNYRKASNTVFSDAAERALSLRNLNDDMERDLKIIGSTAIEDKLQEGVPDAIRSLLRAGIKIWVLTGDKMETAVNIGYLCGLLQGHHKNGMQEMTIIRIKDCTDPFRVRDQLDAAKTQLCDGVELNGQSYAIVIDGKSLEHILQEDELALEFIRLAERCTSVICCRVSPLQKALVVKTVTRHRKVVTLAIGDGANDVSMIQEADVGVGISGQEGLQAALSADYAISQFRFLRRLLLVHGRWSYSRNGSMILNFYLKSFVFSAVVFWFQFYCGFSSSIVYEFTYLLFYNQVFTVAPIMILAAFDRDLEPRVINQFPQIYREDGIRQSMYSHRMFFGYMLEAVWYSLVSFFIPIFAYRDNSTHENGRISGMYFIGTVMAMISIPAVNLSVALDTCSWVWIHHLFYWGSSAIFFAYVAIYSLNPAVPIHGINAEMFGQPVFWLCVTLAVLLSLAPRLLYYAFSRHFSPSDRQILQEWQQKQNRKTRANSMLGYEYQTLSS